MRCFVPTGLCGGLGNPVTLFGRKVGGAGHATLETALASQSDGMGVLAALAGFGMQRLTSCRLNDAEGIFHGV